MNEKSVFFRNQQMIIVSNSQSYFPLLIIYVSTGERKVVQSPKDIENGKSFRVLETNTQLKEV